MNYILLLGTTAIWGMGFIATKWTFAEYSALWSNAIRFAFAGAISIPVLIYFKSYKRSSKDFLWIFLASLSLGGSMLLQTIGLQYTSAAKSGFITCLYSAFIPLLGVVFYKHRYPLVYWLLLCASLFGIALLCDLNFAAFNIGDLYTLLCAVGFAFHFLIVERIAKHYRSAIELNSLQCAIVGALSLLAAFAIEGPVSWESALDWSHIVTLTPSPSLGFLSLSLFSSFIAFAVLAHTQKSIHAATVGVICLLESPFAALFGYLLLDERLNPTNLWGCFIIGVSVLLIPFSSKIQELLFTKKPLARASLS